MNESFKYEEENVVKDKDLTPDLLCLAFFAPWREERFFCVFYLWTLSPGLGNHE